MDFLQMASVVAGVAIGALAIWVSRRHRVLAAATTPPWAARRLGASLEGVAAALEVSAPRRRARDVMRERKRKLRDNVSGGVVNEKCTFCLDSLDRGPDVRVTRCRHAFHSICLEQWVFFCAGSHLDLAQYSLGDDGELVGHAPAPSCPNCSTDLEVISEDDRRRTVVAAIARCLSLADLASAERLFETGLVRLKLGGGRDAGI